MPLPESKKRGEADLTTKTREVALELHCEIAWQFQSDGPRAEIPEDLLGWGNRYLPEHLRRPPSRMHAWIAGELDLMRDRRGCKLNVLAPRGGAKSTLGTLIHPLREALEGREPYSWIVSDTLPQARAHLENIRAELEHNSLIAEDYPGSSRVGSIWRAGKLMLANGVVIEAVSTGQRVRGRRHGPHRPTLIVCDDLQNDSHMRSTVQRDRSNQWFFGTLCRAGTKDTNMLNLATALHRDALALELTHKPGWTSRTFSAIERWPENMSLWKAWEAIYTDLSRPDYRDRARAFYDEHREAMDAGAVLLWPEEEDLYSLMCLRVECGYAVFEREKQNVPATPEACEWPETYFDESIWFDQWPARLQLKSLALDPSKGVDSRGSDFSAVVALGVDEAGLLYVEADLARRDIAQIVADTTEWHLRFAPDIFGVEINQFQDLLAAEFEAEFRRQGLLAARPYPLQNTVNKQVRIRRLGPYLASRRLRFKRGSPGTALLLDQLRAFPSGEHDDGPDALEMALRLAIQIQQGPNDDGLGNRLAFD